MKVVLDCNVLVTSLTSRSPYHSIYTALVGGKFELIVSQDILLEYEEIIQLKYGTGTSSSFMGLLTLLPNVLHTHPFYKWNLIPNDPDDNKYCDCAISGTADFIVTEDRHFRVLTSIEFPRIFVLSTDEFCQKILD
jgi:putative PIN family toxin of toxin-antitoxin system